MARRFGNLEDNFEDINDNNVVESDYKVPETQEQQASPSFEMPFKDLLPQNEEQRIDQEVADANELTPEEELSNQNDLAISRQEQLQNLLQNYNKLKPQPQQDNNESIPEQAESPVASNKLDHRANILSQYNQLMNRDNILQAQKDQAQGKMNAGMLLGAGQLAQAFGTRYGAKIGNNSEGAEMVAKNADIPVQQIAEGQKLVGQQLETLNATEMHDPKSDASKMMRGMAYKMIDKLDPDNKLGLQGQLEDMSAMQMGKLPGMKSLFDNMFKTRAFQQVRDYVGKDEKGKTVGLTYDPTIGSYLMTGTNKPYTGELFYKTPKMTPEKELKLFGLGGDGGQSSSKILSSQRNTGMTVKDLNDKYNNNPDGFIPTTVNASAISNLKEKISKKPEIAQNLQRLVDINSLRGALETNNAITIPQLDTLLARVHLGKGATVHASEAFKTSLGKFNSYINAFRRELGNDGILTDDQIKNLNATINEMELLAKEQYNFNVKKQIKMNEHTFTGLGEPTDKVLNDMLQVQDYQSISPKGVKSKKEPFPIGTIKAGYKYKGGDPNDKNNWDKVK